MPSACVVLYLPQQRWWQVGVCLCWQWHDSRQACLHPSLRGVVSALCVAGADRDLRQVAHVPAPRGDTPWCRTADIFPAMAAGPAPRATTQRAFHLTGPDHCTETTPTPFCHTPFRYDVESVLQLSPICDCAHGPRHAVMYLQDWLLSE